MLLSLQSSQHCILYFGESCVPGEENMFVGKTVWRHHEE